MAQVSYNFYLHPNSPTSLPFTITTGSGTDARIFYFIPNKYLQTLSTLTVPAFMQNSTSGATQYRWNNVLNYDTGTAVRSDTNNQTVSTNLINDFNANNGTKQILCVRVQFVKTNTSYSVAVPNISGIGITPNLNTVSIGDKITIENMENLRTYINNITSLLQVGTSSTITQLTRNTSISYLNWSSYVNKANTLPYVSGITLPTQYTAATAAYYNSIINAICPS